MSNSRTYADIRVTNMAGTITGRVEGLAVEEPDGLLSLQLVAMDAAAVAVTTGRSVGEREHLYVPGPLPYFQMLATEQWSGGSEVVFPRVSLKEIGLRPMNKAGWWYATHEVRAVIRFPITH
jgi:hypothetical protein